VFHSASNHTAAAARLLWAETCRFCPFQETEKHVGPSAVIPGPVPERGLQDEIDRAVPAIAAARAGILRPLPGAVAAHELHGVNFVPARDALRVEVHLDTARRDARRRGEDGVGRRGNLRRLTPPERHLGAGIRQAGDFRDAAGAACFADDDLRDFDRLRELRDEPFLAAVRLCGRPRGLVISVIVSS